MATTRRVLLTGASGLLGREIMKEFCSKEGWEVLGLAFSRATDNLTRVDLTNELETTEIINKFKPHLLIHSAAERRPDVVEKNEAATHKLNVEVSERLAKHVNALNRESNSTEHTMMYISTDYVFDGTKPPYKVADPTNPLNKYGRSKLDGEIVVQSNLPDAIILRVPILYGQVEYVGESAVTVLFDTIKDSKKQSKVSDYEQRYPTLIEDIAIIIQKIAQRQVQLHDMSGIWHWSGPEQMTKYRMCKIIGEVFDLPTDHLTPVHGPTGGAPRPYNTALDRTELVHKLELGSNFPNTFFQDGIKKCLAPFM